MEFFYKNIVNNKITSQIRGIFPCWDNLPRHNSLKSNCGIFLNNNSFLFYIALLKQFLLIKQEKGEYFVINSLNEWGEQCVLEPSIQNDYSYLEAYKLAKKTDLNKINETFIDYILNI